LEKIQAIRVNSPFSSQVWREAITKITGMMHVKKNPIQAKIRTPGETNRYFSLIHDAN
jgi:hypothetical protein